ncbi:MAG: flagellar motor switch protein FliN [Rhizobium sp.]|nr:flagellar motor switch protein FliN [Rhizobium sp.]
MAPKKAKTEDPMELGDNSAELDQAIDDLRGVLKADTDGSVDTGGDFAADFPDVSEPAPAFGGFEAETPDFSSGFGGSSDFGSEFGGETFGSNTSFGGELPNASVNAPVREPGSGMHANLDLIMDIPIDVQIILGASRMQVSSLMNLNEGAIISLDRRIGEPVDLMVNGRLIGRGEITVMEDDETRFGIRLTEIKSVSKS